MRTRLILLFSALLSASTLAQNYLLTPSSGTEKEGPDSTLIFGWAANMSHRFMDLSHAGTARAIKGVSFRLDYRDHNAIGRTWSNVQIWAAHGDYSSIQYNKSTAYKLVDTPVKVFDQQWSFPALKGKPALNPATWGGIANSLNFRFTKAFNYNGKDSIFLEFRFSGGKAHNNQAWVGLNPKGFEYYLDSMPQEMWRGTGGNQTYPIKGKGCYDSSFLKPSYTGAKLSGTSTVTLDIESLYTSRTSPVIHALGFQGNPLGLNVGAACGLFYPSLTGPLVLMIRPAPNNATGSMKTSLSAPRAPWMNEFWAQAVWLDSKTNALKMTNAMRASIAGQKLVPAATSYMSGNSAFQVWTAAAKGMPYIRYEY